MTTKPKPLTDQERAEFRALLSSMTTAQLRTVVLVVLPAVKQGKSAREILRTLNDLPRAA